ncbi:hypothetical protein P618_200234 [Holospora obtusa F1]|uniref:Uncharacterized protein n=1 Tax=Holospora obtusa F1 TaxID=1399147 RepID=W6TF35_HOLOB|nr:hypothetical protein [Holospora obtusa]ETZ07574.1 hypothetical protein P618_200234 [Holospora obtusa F1]
MTEEYYNCFQDVLDAIYNSDENPMDCDTESYWIDIISKFVLNKQDLLQKLEQYFNMWDLGERGVDYLEKIGEFYEYERASWCFYYLFLFLSDLKDPSFIPEVMKYFPPDGEHHWPWCMEDMWTEPMLAEVANYHDFGPTYIPWIMRSLHLLYPGAEWVAENFMFSMIYDTFSHITPDTFPDLPVVDALPLGKREIVRNLLEKEVFGWNKTLQKDKEKLAQALCEQEKKFAYKDVESAKESLACAEYVLGQLLLLPEEVVGIGHR